MSAPTPIRPSTAREAVDAFLSYLKRRGCSAKTDTNRAHRDCARSRHVRIHVRFVNRRKRSRRVRTTDDALAFYSAVCAPLSPYRADSSRPGRASNA